MLFLLLIHALRFPSRNARRCPARLPPSLTHAGSQAAPGARAAVTSGGSLRRSVMHWPAPWSGGAGRASPPDRRSAARTRAPPRRAAGRPPRASRDDPDEPARARAGARRSSSCSRPAPTNGWIRPNRPPRTISSGSRMLTRPASPIAEPAADVVEGAQRGRDPASARAASRRPRRDRRSGGRPARRSSAASPTSVSQQPTEPQRHGAAVRVDRHVPDLAAVAGGTGQRLRRRR